MEQKQISHLFPVPFLVLAPFLRPTTLFTANSIRSKLIEADQPTPFKAQVCFVTKSSFYLKWKVILSGKVKVFEAVELSKNLKGICLEPSLAVE